MSWTIDYHIHTIYSDGAMNPRDIVRACEAKGMSNIAITDHDGIDGVHEALIEGRNQGIQVTTGIELATEDDTGVGLHILGYGFDPENKCLLDQLEFMTEERDKRNVKLIKVLQNMGCDITFQELMNGRLNSFIGKPVIARMLAKKGYVESWQGAFARGVLLGSEEARAVRKVKVNSCEAIKTIMAAGGVAVLAHPIQAKRREAPDDENYYKRMDLIIERLKAAGLYGIECYHPDQNEIQSGRFLDMAEKYELKVSRGTDFHGDDYDNAKTTADYVEQGNENGFGIFPRDFIDV